MKLPIFISYRRDDAAAEARALYTALRQTLGVNSTFMDTSDIPPGRIWPDELIASLRKSNTVLVVIGPAWLQSCDEWSRRRIDLDDDWVRKEISLALQQNKTVIPILVRAAVLPPSNVLPEDLKELPTRQKIDLRRDYWDHDLELVLNYFDTKQRKAMEAKQESIEETKKLSPEETQASLIHQYSEIRKAQQGKPSEERTRAMASIARQMIELAPQIPHPHVAEYLQSTNCGQRLFAYTYLYACPRFDQIRTLVDSIVEKEDRPFGQVWGLRALRQLIKVRQNESVQESIVEKLRGYYRTLPQGIDRRFELEQIFQQLNINVEGD